MPDQDRETMTDREKQLLKGRLQGILIGHVGKSQIIGMGELYEQVFAEKWEHRINDTRRLRKLIEELRREGLQICSDPARVGGGFYIASTTSELADYCEKLRHRALKILAMEARIRKVSLAELAGQLRLDLEAME